MAGQENHRPDVVVYRDCEAEDGAEKFKWQALPSNQFEPAVVCAELENTGDPESCWCSSNRIMNS
jgi:hypothetical protein